ncbi:MAG: DUF1552 domain-containing protein [Myxococcales bacterium]
MSGVGAALVAAPFLRLLAPAPRVRAAQKARRIIVWFSPNGTVHRFYRPTGADTNFSFAPGSILEPLAEHKQDLLILDGLNFERVRGGSHEGGMEHMLTGGGAISVDQFIAQKIGANAPFSSIELGVQTSAWGASIQTRMSYNQSHQFVAPEDDPVQAYKRLFGAAPTSGASGDTDPMGRKGVIDLVRGELKALEKQLGGEERVKLDAHLDALRSLEKRLSGPAAGACGTLTAPSLSDSRSNEHLPDVGELQMDLLVAAAACDLSPVLSLQWSHTVSPAILSWAQANQGHHELSHMDDSNTAGVQEFVRAERWFASQFAAFLERLANTQEADGSGSLLDTSTVVWVKELGDSRLHDFKSVPFIIAGGGNGNFKTGRYLQFNGAPHQKLLVSLCQSMGVDVDSFGVSDISGGLSGLGG